ncbi:uncharacterized protein LOC129726190 [Wyeomyia smithii]|uniref:uncharacterized protein LOC129726190 n=1 Tax=Wyeomyia smithii TaxID=174621 RepID=UPI0024681BF4|nr:uncharacterized protein LOC129726190 [Wyeomyia smithii]
MRSLSSRLKYFADCCSLHGLRYLGNRCKFRGRIFWLCILSCSLTSMSYIFLYTLKSFDETVNIHIDTSHLRWNNTFPAVSICYTKGRIINSIANFFENHWRENNISKPAKSSNYFRLAQSYLFVSPNSNIDLRGSVCTGMNSTCDMNWETMQKMY